MESFIVENLIGKRVAINCGSNDIYIGVVNECNNKVITLKQDNGQLFINIDKIITIKELNN